MTRPWDWRYYASIKLQGQAWAMPGSFKLCLEICPKPLFENKDNRKVFDLEMKIKDQFRYIKNKVHNWFWVLWEQNKRNVLFIAAETQVKCDFVDACPLSNFESFFTARFKTTLSKTQVNSSKRKLWHLGLFILLYVLSS